jgi:hypothetical protein
MAALVGVLPKTLAEFVARLEPYGLTIRIGLLILLPLLGAQTGLDLEERVKDWRNSPESLEHLKRMRDQYRKATTITPPKK